MVILFTTSGSKQTSSSNYYLNFSNYEGGFTPPFLILIVSKGMFPHKEEIIATILDFCKPEKIVLFGSRAKGNFTKHSDIDLAIFLRKELSRRQKRLLKERLDIVAGIYSVDIVFSDEFEEKLKEEVNKTGVVVWKR